MKPLLRGYFKFLYGSVVSSYTKALFGFFEKNPSAILVDVGCWDGANSVKFKQSASAAKVIGFEIVAAAAAKAKENGVEVRLCDLNKKIPLKPSAADVVVANHVIEHLYNVDGFAGEIFRILKPGGYLLLGTPNLASWHNVLALIAGRQPFSGPTVGAGSSGGIAAEMKNEKKACLLSDVHDKGEGEDALGHVVVMTYKTLVSLLKSKGFIIEQSCCFGYYPFPPFLARVLAKVDKSHSHYVLVKARKPG